MAACGGHRGTAAANGPFRLGAFEPSLRVHGALPGAPVSVHTPPQVVRRSMRRLVTVRGMGMQLPLYVARDHAGFLCIGSTGVWECLRPEDAQPVFSFTLQGGHGDIRDWGAIVGLAAPDIRVTAERLSKEVELPLRRFPHFQWAAFASPMWMNGGPDALRFYDRAGHRLSGFIDLAFSASACPGGGDNCKAPSLWHHVGDPLLDASGAGRRLIERAKRIAFADPLVRKLLAERRYSFAPPAAWSKCSGGTIGVILSFHIAPATFTEDWPSADYDASSHTAYVEHVTYFEVARVTQLDVSVDTNERRVVGVDPTNSSPDGPEPQVDEFSAHPVDGGKPGGGPDKGDCSSSGD
jgi:hypothetical protein